MTILLASHARSIIPDPWEILTLAFPVLLAVATIAVLVHAVIEHHCGPKRKPMGRAGLKFTEMQPRCRGKRRF